MRCISCGAEISDGLLFCPTCGALAKSERNSVIEHDVQPAADVFEERIPEIASFETLQSAEELEDVVEASSVDERASYLDVNGDSNPAPIEDATRIKPQGSSFEIVETENQKPVSRNALGPFVVSSKLFIVLAVALAAAFIILGIALFLPDKLSQRDDGQTATQSVAEDREAETSERADNSSEPQTQVIARSEATEHTELEVQHEAVKSQTESFWGVWVMASKDKGAADNVANELRANGYDSSTVITTDWANLNNESWYVVTAGRFRNENDANSVIPKLVADGYQGAYSKFSGEYVG